MREIGQTNEGALLYELTEREVRAFSYLQQVAAGRVGEHQTFFGDCRVHGDLAPAFAAITAWIMAVEPVNRLQSHINNLRSVLQFPEGQD